MNKSDRGPASMPPLHPLYQALVAGFATVALTGVAPLAFAQEASDAPAAKLDSVTVTARKVTEQQLDVPISVQAISEKELRASGTYDLYDLRAIGGFNFNTYSGTAANGRSNGVIVFRGLQGGTGLIGENSGSLFIDGIYISSGQATVNTVDVARVEILKGPQNAFFGRSTFGGAINYITKQPAGERLEGQINGTLTERGSNEFDATIEGPIIRGLVNGRLTVYNHYKEPTYRASDGGSLGEEKTRGVTGTLYITPTENTWVRLRSNFQKDDDSMPAVGYISATKFGGTCAGVGKNALDFFGNPIQFQPGVQYFCGSIPTHSSVGNGVIDANTNLPISVSRTLSSNDQGDQFLSDAPKLDHTGLRRDSNHSSLQTGMALPYNMDLVFNGGYNQSNQVSVYDLDASTGQNFLPIQTINAHDTTLDLRLSSDRDYFVRGLVGVSYFQQSYHLSQVDYAYNTTTTQLPCPLGAISATPGCTNLNTGNFANNRSKVPAFYGSVDYDIFKWLTINAEARRQHDTIVSQNFFATARYSNTAKNWLPRVSLRLKPTDDLMIYASASKGVQPLSLNTGYISANTTQRAYISSVVQGASEYTPQPELKSYEVGIKQRLLNDTVQYSLTAYDSRWYNRLTNAQIFNPAACVAAGQGNTTACPLPVAGTSVFYGNDARIKGVELQVDALVMRNWNVGGNATYTDGRWMKYYAGGSTSSLTNPNVLNRNAYYFNGNEIGKQPKWVANANTTYRMPGIYEDFGGYVRGDVFFTGRSWDSDFNYARADSFYKVNLRAGAEKRNVTVELFVKNLLNNKDWNWAYRGADLSLVPLTSFSQQGVYVGAPDPREVGVRLAYKF